MNLSVTPMGMRARTLYGLEDPGSRFTRDDQDYRDWSVPRGMQSATGSVGICDEWWRRLPFDSQWVVIPAVHGRRGIGSILLK